MFKIDNLYYKKAIFIKLSYLPYTIINTITDHKSVISIIKTLPNMINRGFFNMDITDM